MISLLYNQDHQPLDLDALAREAGKEERKINSTIRNLVGANEAKDGEDSETPVSLDDPEEINELLN